MTAWAEGRRLIRRRNETAEGYSMVRQPCPMTMGGPANRYGYAPTTLGHAAAVRIERATTSELLAEARRYREVGGSWRDAFLTPEVRAYLNFLVNFSGWSESRSAAVLAARERLSELPGLERWWLLRYAEDVALEEQGSAGGRASGLPVPDPWPPAGNA